MKNELQDKLFNDFPLLYGDRKKPMSQTAMCWGIDCGDGWFDLIYELSSQLEPLIEKIRRESKFAACYKCGCDYDDHCLTLTGERVCKVVHTLPYAVNVWGGCGVAQWKKDIKLLGLKKGVAKSLKLEWGLLKWRSKNRANRVLYRLYELGLGYEKDCHCLNHEPYHPRASQVKEKYGGLRMYLTSGTDEIYDLIDAAEKKSEAVCEVCSAPGTQNERGWIHTLCKPCRAQRNAKS